LSNTALTGEVNNLKTTNQTMKEKFDLDIITANKKITDLEKKNNEFDNAVKDFKHKNNEYDKAVKDLKHKNNEYDEAIRDDIYYIYSGVCRELLDEVLRTLFSVSGKIKESYYTDFQLSNYFSNLEITSQEGLKSRIEDIFLLKKRFSKVIHSPDFSNYVIDSYTMDVTKWIEFSKKALSLKGQASFTDVTLINNLGKFIKAFLPANSEELSNLVRPQDMKKVLDSIN
jgi:hypothetical protein